METDGAGGDSRNNAEGEASTSTKETEVNGQQEKGGVKREEEVADKVEKCRRIFKLAYVNSYGSSDTMPALQDNGRALTLTSEW